MPRYIQSPLNYTGGKYRLLPQIMPLLPERSRVFVDLFCGGCNVGVNAGAETVIFNDLEPRLTELLATLSRMNPDEAVARVMAIIDRSGLSDTALNGYRAYGCDSARGLASFNRTPFNRLRDEFNRLTPDADLDEYYLTLYTLIVFSFNNQLRFNNRGEFNLPAGKRDFNNRMRAKLHRFVERISRGDCMFISRDFREFDTGPLTPDDFVYADPPYITGLASYNEKNGWTIAHEYDLLDLLDSLDRRGIRFALSNLLTNKGRTNPILAEWLRARPRYICHHLDYSYANSSYHVKDRRSANDEVLITNYILPNRNA